MSRRSLQKKIKKVRPPKVHIEYDVNIGDAIEKRSLPLIVGVLGDLSNQPAIDEEGVPVKVKDRRFIRIDRDNFDKVMSDMAPKVNYRVPNRLSEQGGELRGELEFRSMEDFHPRKVCEQVKPLAELLARREKLAFLKRKLNANDGPLPGLLEELVAARKKPEMES